MGKLTGQADRVAKRIELLATCLRLFLIVLALSSVAGVTYILAAANLQASGSVTVAPESFYTGDSIEISLKGFPPDYPVPAGAVTLSGVRVPIPCTFCLG